MCLCGLGLTGTSFARPPGHEMGRDPGQPPMFAPPPPWHAASSEERSQWREQWREERRQRREAWREMSPEERHQLRRDIRDAGRYYRRGPAD